jgi:hypothetical protein
MKLCVNEYYVEILSIHACLRILMLIVYPCMIIMINIYLLFMDDSWEKEKTLF